MHRCPTSKRHLPPHFPPEWGRRRMLLTKPPYYADKLLLRFVLTPSRYGLFYPHVENIALAKRSHGGDASTQRAEQDPFFVHKVLFSNGQNRWKSLVVRRLSQSLQLFGHRAWNCKLESVRVGTEHQKHSHSQTERSESSSAAIRRGKLSCR
jgi:hypothetical protein